MSEELEAHVREVHDFVPWLCFCVLCSKRSTLSDTQISVILHLDLKQIRASLNQLWKDDLISRVNANGLWRVDPIECCKQVLTRLNRMQDVEVQRRKDTPNYDTLYCPTCKSGCEIECRIITAMERGEDPVCCSCNDILGSWPICDDDGMLEHIQRRISILQEVITMRASSSADISSECPVRDLYS